MNTTYQNTYPLLPRSRSSLSPKPEHPNTAYRPSPVFHMGSLAHTQKTPTNPGMVAQPEAGNGGRKTERAAMHKTAGPTIRCKDAVWSVRGGLSSTGLTPVVQSAKASDRNSTGSNPVHPNYSRLSLNSSISSGCSSKISDTLSTSTSSSALRDCILRLTENLINSLTSSESKPSSGLSSRYSRISSHHSFLKEGLSYSLITKYYSTLFLRTVHFSNNYLDKTVQKRQTFFNS